jgi:hypothetical protein
LPKAIVGAGMVLVERRVVCPLGLWSLFLVHFLCVPPREGKPQGKPHGFANNPPPQCPSPFYSRMPVSAPSVC